jgi:hypothetical protein
MKIQPICAGFSPSGTVHRTINGPAFGGSGGGATSGMCADGSVVTGIRVGTKLSPGGGDNPQYVDFIELECTKLTDLNRVVASNSNTVCIAGSLGCYARRHMKGGIDFGGDYQPFAQRCPFNEGHRLAFGTDHPAAVGSTAAGSLPCRRPRRLRHPWSSRTPAPPPARP